MGAVAGQQRSQYLANDCDIVRRKYALSRQFSGSPTIGFSFAGPTDWPRSQVIEMVMSALMSVNEFAKSWWELRYGPWIEIDNRFAGKAIKACSGNFGQGRRCLRGNLLSAIQLTTAPIGGLLLCTTDDGSADNRHACSELSKESTFLQEGHVSLVCCKATKGLPY
jgi:hypothetical protein